MKNGKSPGWRAGALVAFMVTAAWLGISFAAWRVAGTPFAPFDFFDWMARILPGSVLAAGIDSMVLCIQVLGINPLAAAAKVAEQTMAIGGAWILGAGVGMVLFRTMRPDGGRRAYQAGVGAGIVAGVCISLATGRLSQTARIGGALSWLWTLAEFGMWGLAIAWACRRLRSSGVAPEQSAQPEVERVDRRHFLIKLSGGTAVLTVAGAAVGELGGACRKTAAAAKGERWSARNSLPNADAAVKPAPGTRPELTPLEKHYRIDIDTTPPEIEEQNWKLQVFGLVEHPVAFALEELRRYEPLHQFVTLACVSNPVGGDLIGTTRWTGVSLNRLLPAFQLGPKATHLKIRSADGFFEVLDIAAARKDERIMLCYAWDGVPLTSDHGFPLRIYIPDLYGMKQPKWIVSLEAIDQWEPGYWVARGWDKTARMKATSVIDTVSAQPTKAANGAGQIVSIGGIAHAGARGVSEVEIRVDEGAWQTGELRTSISPLTWVLWRYDWPFAPGQHTFTVRCIEADGTPQIEARSSPRPSGATGLVTRTRSG